MTMDAKPGAWGAVADGPAPSDLATAAFVGTPFAASPRPFPGNGPQPQQHTPHLQPGLSALASGLLGRRLSSSGGNAATPPPPPSTTSTPAPSPHPSPMDRPLRSALMATVFERRSSGGGSNGGGGGGGGGSSSRTAKMHALYKTELCRTWLAGERCAYGDRCNFAHGGGELRAPAVRLNSRGSLGGGGGAGGGGGGSASTPSLRGPRPSADWAADGGVPSNATTHGLRRAATTGWGEEGGGGWGVVAAPSHRGGPHPGPGPALAALLLATAAADAVDGADGGGGDVFLLPPSSVFGGGNGHAAAPAAAWLPPPLADSLDTDGFALPGEDDLLVGGSSAGDDDLGPGGGPGARRRGGRRRRPASRQPSHPLPTTPLSPPPPPTPATSAASLLDEWVSAAACLGEGDGEAGAAQPPFLGLASSSSGRRLPVFVELAGE